MFGNAGQARTNAAMLVLQIATTSSRTCTKPIVACCKNFVLGLPNNRPVVNGSCQNFSSFSKSEIFFTPFLLKPSSSGILIDETR